MTPVVFTDSQIAVIYALAENRLKPYTACQQAYMSPSGFMYHVDVIKRKTGKDPRDFYDMVDLLAAVKEQERKGQGESHDKP